MKLKFWGYPQETYVMNMKCEALNGGYVTYRTFNN